MKKTLVCLWMAAALLHADDDTFRERFADPTTRTAALSELIPGTREMYFHTALDHQLAGREAEFRKTMADWKSATERKNHPVSAIGMAVLENRQLLLDYQTKPESSLAELIRRLNLKFDDSHPATQAAEVLPATLDPAFVSEVAFEKAATERSPEKPYTQYEGQRILRELDRVDDFDEPKLRWFLVHLGRADHPSVVPLIDRSLKLEKPVSFGSLALHRKLTSSQLASLLDRHPALRSNQDFAISYLAKLLPGSEVDFQRDLTAHSDHLRRCRDFVLPLPPALNSLKAHVLFHHLRLQAELGNHPQDDFITFLALPRSSHSLLRTFKTEPPDSIQLNADFAAATACPSVGDDLPLIHSYLTHLLGRADSATAFAPYIPEGELSRIHARARLLNGADYNRWGSMLDPAEFQKLQDEARIDFAPGAPRLLDSDAKVSLTLDLKNTPDLLVRIYELDLPAHLTRSGREPDVTIDLEGLVPHHERRLSFSQPAIVQHRETIDLPELTGSGAWLVDFTGGQVSARAIIRKGHLIAYIERNAAGQTVRVFDETGHPVSSASIVLGRETFMADAAGRIVIPDTPNQPVTRGIVRSGKLAAPVSLGSRTDELKLHANFHLEREQLLAEQIAELHLRLKLSNHGHELPLDRLKNPALTLKAELLGGVTTERVIAENLELAPVMEIPFQVPADLLKLTLTFSGTVTPSTGGDPVKLGDHTTCEINTELKHARIATAFFSPTAEGHRLEVRGRNGEPLPSRPVTLEFHRADFDPEIRLQLRTDANGGIDLGKLDTIDFLAATGAGIPETLYEPKLRTLDYTSSIHLPAGREIRLPLEKPADAPNRLALSLLETRDQIPVRDHFDKIAIENGEIVIRGLSPGDYQFTQGDETTDIIISSGVEIDGLLVSPSRILPLHTPFNPTVASADAENDQVRVQLRGHGPDTRVTLIGKRYRHGEWDPGAGLYPFWPPISETLRPGFLGCGYLTDRRLSDETRYILDRRAAKSFPGSMLPRPGLLLHRWTEEDSSQSLLTGEAGNGGSNRGALERQSETGRTPSRERNEETSSELPIVCDFLATPAVVRFNLTPASDGSLTVPLANFTGCQFIEIVATDLHADDSLILPLPANDTPVRDRRIARPFDSKIHYQATRNAAVLAKGASASIANLLDADWRAFTTLAEAHQFLYGMTADPRLLEFVFLTEWSDLTEEKKLELLSKHACHELHLFLARKDQAFFEKHVKPLLAQKPAPTFIDDLLLGRNLTSYLRPFAWQRLNAAEKALLSQALPDRRKSIARELSLRWEIEAPSPDAETTLFTQTLRGSDLALEDSLGLARNELKTAYLGSSANALIRNKLDSIIIPKIDFEDTSIEEAIDFLRLRAAELDTTELDPSRKGVNIVLRIPKAVSENPDLLRIREFHVSNIPLSIALKYICDQTKLHYKVDDYGVTLMLLTECNEDIFTRTFQVPPDFAAQLDAGSAVSDDPFAEPEERPTTLKARPSITELLKQSGINFPEGASATLGPNGNLIVTSTPTELDKIEQLTAVLSSSSPAGIQPAADGFTNEEGSLLSAAADDEIEVADPFCEPSGAAATLSPRKPIIQRPQLFPDRTRIWQEANYLGHTGTTDESFIPLNRFWLDLSAWDGNGQFLSPHFNACHTHANEALMCLAVLDLPFKAERPDVTVDGSTLRVKAREPMLLFYKDTRPTEKLAAESPLLVRQTFSPLAEPFRTVNGQQRENPVTGDFRPGVPYLAALVITNPTGIGRRIDVLAQIPAGAIPLDGKPATLSSTHEIAPHGVVKLELAFYFPAAGDFPVYPLHVSEGGVVLAHTEPRTLRVSGDPEPQDTASWFVIAREGSNDEVLNRLRTENLNAIDLSEIHWRLKDRPFFLGVAKILRERLYFSADIAAFGFYHNDPETMREYLENSEACRQLGEWLDSPLLEIRPGIHLDWHTLEFDPLINPRSHRFTSASRLTHDVARQHYHAFLDQLAWKPTLDASDHLTLAAFLFLQDRIDEGLAQFDQIDPAKLPGRVNYDYLRCVALFHREKPEDAKAIAAQNLPALPPGMWRDRFQAVVEQANEIAALNQPTEAPIANGETTAPRLDLTLGDNGKLVIHHRGLEKVGLRLYSVDLEMLFSNDPFLSGGSAEPSIRPNETLDIQLATTAAETTIDLPEALRNGNLLVFAESGDSKTLKVLDSRALEVRHTPHNRTIQVVDASTSKPLPKTYVKVYAETHSGEVVFHKDGYTDLRGKFDYLSHTGSDPSTIKRLALFVSHPALGARTTIFDR